MTKNCEKGLQGVFNQSEIDNLQEIVDGLKRDGMDDLEARIAGAQQILGLETQRQLEVDALVREAVGMPQYVQPTVEIQPEQASDTPQPEGAPKPRTKAEKRGLPPALEAKMVKKTPGEMRAEIARFLGRDIVNRLEKLGVLILDKNRRIKTDAQGNKRAVQGAYDPGKGTIRLYGGTQHQDRSTVGVMMHEGSHAGMNRILDGQLAEFVNDIIKQAAAGNDLAIDALIKAKAATLEPAQVFANDLQGYRAREEIVAYYVQNSVDSGVQSGIFRRLMNRMKAKFSLTPFGKAARAVGVKVELTPEMAVEFAREAVRDTIETVQVLNKLERAVAAKSGGSINSKKKPAKAQLDSATDLIEGMPGKQGENASLRDTGIRMVDGQPMVSINEETILVKDRINMERATKLEDVLEDSDLFAAYPSLRNYPVSYSRLEGAPAARINDRIFIDSRATNPTDVRDAILAQLDQIMADQDGWLGFEGERTPSNYPTLGKLYAQADNAQMKREIKRLMTDPAAAAITDAVLESSTTKAAPGADLGRLAQLLGPKLYGDKSKITSVSTKELFQNAFDAVRAELMAGRIEHGFIDIKLDDEERSITIQDNGPGMSIDQINNAFLKIAGTDKPGEVSSGGLGIAKMLFLFGNERLELITVKNGKKHTLRGTGEQFMQAFQDPEVAPEIVTEDTKWTPRTIVKVVIPEKFQDAATGQEREISFPPSWMRHDVPKSISESPLFQPIDVSYNDQVVNIGQNFPSDDYVPFTTVNFEWGTADIIISKSDNEQTEDNVIILSNGLQQFSMALKENPFEMGSKMVPKKIYIDVHPRVKPEEEGYPFDLNRQRFSPAIEGSFNQIINYLSVLYGGSQAAETAEGFGEIEYVNADGSTGDPFRLAPEVKEDNLKKMLQVDKDSKMEVVDGKLTLNGKPLPELTAEDLEEVRIDLESFKIPQDQVDATKPMIHSNMLVKSSPEMTALSEARAALKIQEKIVTQFREEWKALSEEKDKMRDELGPDAYDSEEYMDLDRRENEAYQRYTEESDKSSELKTKRNEAAYAVDDAEHEMSPLLGHLRERFGEEKVNKYLGGLGDAFREIRDAVVQLDPDNYLHLEHVPVGTSFDKEYYGVHIWVPFEGMFINPGTAVFADPERAGMAMYMTMVHEIAHHRNRGHNASFVSELQRLTTLLEAGGMDTARLKQRMSNLVEYNYDIFSYIHEETENGSLTNIGKRFSEPSYDQRPGGYTSDMAGVGETAAGGSSVAGRLADGSGDFGASPVSRGGFDGNAGTRSVEELESAYNETLAAAGDMISPRLLESVGLPEAAGITVDPPLIDLNEGNLLSQSMADPQYVRDRIAHAVGPELESAVDAYVEASAETQRQLDDLLRAASEQVGHTVGTVTEAMQVLGDERFENFLAGEQELEQLTNALLGEEALAEAQQIFAQNEAQQAHREAYLRDFPLSNFKSVQEVIDTLEEAGIPQDSYLIGDDKLTLIEGIPILLEVMESEVDGGVTIAFVSLQDVLLRRGGYERQMFFRNPTAAFRKITSELLEMANNVAPKYGANKVIFAPSNDARAKLYRRGLKKLGVPFIFHKANIYMDLPEQRVLDNLRAQQSQPKADRNPDYDPDSVNVLESSEPIDLNKVRQEKQQAKELQEFADKLREKVRGDAQRFAKMVEEAGHMYEVGDIVILRSGRRARILGKTLVKDYREPLPPFKEYKARKAVVDSRPKVPGYRMEYGENGELHVSDLGEYSIKEPFTGPKELESSISDLIEPARKWLWKDRLDPEEAHHLGHLQRFLVNYYDDTWTMEAKNEQVWDKYDLAKSRRSAMIDEINRNFMDPMKKLVRESGLTMKEVDDWLAARHVVEDNVNRNLAERSSLHYINKLAKHLQKPARLEMNQRKAEIMKQDASPKRIREQMYALMNEYAEYEVMSFDPRSGTTRQAVKEEWEDFKRHASGLYDPRSGLDNRGGAMNAAEIYNRYSGNRKVEAIADLYDKMTTEHLEILREGGTITDAEYTALLEENPHYVPLRRESFDYETQFSFLKEQGAGPAKGVTVRGGSADVDPPIHIMQNTFARMHMAAGHAQRNLANNFLYEQIMADRRNWLDWFTVNEDNTRDRHTALGFVVEGGTAALDNTDIIVLRNGKRLIIKPIKQNERARVFAAAANRLGAQEVSGVFKIFGWVNSIVRFTAVSASPSFLLANMIRDPLTALYNMEATQAEAYTKEIRGNYKKAFKALLEVYVGGNRDPNSAAVQMVERFEKAGGKISFTQSLKEMDNSWSSFERSMWAEGTPGVKQVVHLFQQIENTNIAIENVMRLATFEALYNKPDVGTDKAARIAKDLTTNFDRRGFKSSAMGLLYLFFNATIQGNAQVVRNLSKSKKLQGMVAGTIVMAALFDLIGRALSDEDEYGNNEWDKITGKDRNIVLPIPINGVYIRIPAPWVYNVVWRSGGMLSETVAGVRSAPDTASEMAAMVLTTFNPMGGGTVAQALTPTALDPVMQVIENKDFAGNQLRPMNFPGAGAKPDSELAWQSTPAEYKWLARQLNELTGGDVAHSGWIDVAPSTIQNTVNFLGGGLARFASNVLSMPADLARDELELKNVPIIRQLTTSPGTSIDTQMYYDKVAQVLAAEKAVKDYGEGATRDLAKRDQAKKDYAKELRLVRHVKDVERQLKSLRQRRRAAQGRKDKKQVEMLTDRINSVQRRFLATFENRMR